MVFDRTKQNGSFFYSWPQLTYSLLDWLHVGLAAQRTTYHTSLTLSAGCSSVWSHKKLEFTSYIFNPGWSDPGGC